jgi:hypothetical protein
MFLREFNVQEEAYFENLDQSVGDNDFLGRLVIQKGRSIPRRKGRAATGFLL